MAGVPGEVVRGKDVDYIKSRILQPALTSHFRVMVSGPLGESWNNFLKEQGFTWDQETLNLSCSETTLPGSSLATHELNNDRTGVTERHAYRRLYDDRIDLTFYVNGDDYGVKAFTGYSSIRFFEYWIKYIVNEYKNPPREQIPGSGQPNFYYRMRYPNSYYGSLQIVKFERDYSGELRYTFVNPYPVSINSIPVSYEASSLLKCTVSLTYSRYYVDAYKLPQRESGNQNPNSPANPENDNPTQSEIPTPQVQQPQILLRPNEQALFAKNQAAFSGGINFNVDPGTLGSKIFEGSL